MLAYTNEHDFNSFVRIHGKLVPHPINFAEFKEAIQSSKRQYN
jgi:ligand-binding sensor protein